MLHPFPGCDSHRAAWFTSDLIIFVPPFLGALFGGVWGSSWSPTFNPGGFSGELSLGVFSVLLSTFFIRVNSESSFIKFKPRMCVVSELKLHDCLCLLLPLNQFCRTSLSRLDDSRLNSNFLCFLCFLFCFTRTSQQVLHCYITHFD